MRAKETIAYEIGLNWMDEENEIMNLGFLTFELVSNFSSTCERLLLPLILERFYLYFNSPLQSSTIVYPQKLSNYIYYCVLFCVCEANIKFLCIKKWWSLCRIGTALVEVITMWTIIPTHTILTMLIMLHLIL